MNHDPNSGRGQGGGQDPLSKVQDAVGAAVGKMSASTMGSHNAKSFVKNAAIGNLYEIEAARTALDRTRSGEIRNLAQMIIDDHTQVANRMSSYVSGAGTDLEIPDHLDERRKGMVDNLRTISDGEFDKQYIRQQVAAHDEMLTLFRGFADSGDDAELKSFARETTPTLEKHMERAKALRAD